MDFWEVVRDVLSPGSPRTEHIKHKMNLETERLRSLAGRREFVPLHYLDEITLASQEAVGTLW